MTIGTLEMSKDRKVTNGVNKVGTQASMKNTFGLPAGSNFSCPGMTEVCGAVCYANKLEKAFPSMLRLVMRNWDQVREASYAELVAMLDTMLNTFEAEADKRGLPKFFRIHHDGDFFSEDYTLAWAEVIRRHADVHFWVYTRVAQYAAMLHKANLANLSLYFSTDRANLETARAMKRTYGMRIAYLADTFKDGQDVVKAMTGKPGAKCPEQTGALPLVSTSGSACVRCGLCVFGKADIVFSSSRK